MKTEKKSSLHHPGLDGPTKLAKQRRYASTYLFNHTYFLDDIGENLKFLITALALMDSGGHHPNLD